MEFRLEQIGSNMNAVHIADYTYYFSYETCIAIYTWLSDSILFMDEKRYSVTTSKHMNHFKGKHPKDKHVILTHEQFVEMLDRNVHTLSG